MKTKIIAFILAAASVSHMNAKSQPGFGAKETQRTILGSVLGMTTGGIIGHQHGKQKEGIILGGVIGGIIGNRSGANKDYRNDQAHREMSARERYFARKQSQQQQHHSSLRNQDPRFHSPAPSYTPAPMPHISDAGQPHLDPQVIAARQQAEKAEFELQRQLEARRRQQEKQRMLIEYQQRAAVANDELSNMHRR